MILTRSALPAWAKPLTDHGDWFSVFFEESAAIVWQYSFSHESGRVTLRSWAWWGRDGGSGFNGDIRGNMPLPPDVLVAAGQEVLLRAGKRPRKSPFWWVVKLRDGRYVYADDEFTQYASAARTFTHRSDAEDCAISCPYDARVVRVRARGGS